MTSEKCTVAAATQLQIACKASCTCEQILGLLDTLDDVNSRRQLRQRHPYHSAQDKCRSQAAADVEADSNSGRISISVVPCSSLDEVLHGLAISNIFKERRTCP